MKKTVIGKVTNLLARIPSALLSVLTILLILWLTLSPDPLGHDSPRLFPGADKVAHALMFGFLTTMILLDYVRKSDWRPASERMAVYAAAGATIFGCLIEVAQREMALGRGFEYTDMLADFIGSLICAAGWFLIVNPWLRRFHENSN